MPRNKKNHLIYHGPVLSFRKEISQKRLKKGDLDLTTSKILAIVRAIETWGLHNSNRPVLSAMAAAVVALHYGQGVYANISTHTAPNSIKQNPTHANKAVAKAANIRSEQCRPEEKGLYLNQSAAVSTPSIAQSFSMTENTQFSQNAAQRLSVLEGKYRNICTKPPIKIANKPEGVKVDAVLVDSYSLKDFVSSFGWGALQRLIGSMQSIEELRDLGAENPSSQNSLVSTTLEGKNTKPLEQFKFKQQGFIPASCTKDSRSIRCIKEANRVKEFIFTDLEVSKKRLEVENVGKDIGKKMNDRFLKLTRNLDDSQYAIARKAYEAIIRKYNIHFSGSIALSQNLGNCGEASDLAIVQLLVRQQHDSSLKKIQMVSLFNKSGKLNAWIKVLSSQFSKNKEIIKKREGVIEDDSHKLILLNSDIEDIEILNDSDGVIKVLSQISSGMICDPWNSHFQGIQKNRLKMYQNKDHINDKIKITTVSLSLSFDHISDNQVRSFLEEENKKINEQIYELNDKISKKQSSPSRSAAARP